MRPGEQLKDLRTRLGITTREVTEKSQRIGEAEGNEEFSVSAGWLTQIENTDSTPSIYKLYSLSTIYHTNYIDLLALFGVDLGKIPQHQLAMPLEHTHRTDVAVSASTKVAFPIRFDPAFSLERTNLLSRMVELWGDLPFSLIQHLDTKNHSYGYIGLQDYTLYPLLRPGTFVQLDPKVRKVQPTRWRTEFERPIYFVELRDGYACSWCEVLGAQLLLVPHPLSPCRVQQYANGEDAEIVGQVTGIAMRITEPPKRNPDDTPELPRRV